MNRAKFYTPVSLAVLLFFGMAVPAHAITTLTSSPLFVGNGLAVICAIANVGPHPITVTVQVINVLGAVVKEADGSFSPGQAGSLGESGPLDSAYCKFTGNFKRGFVRANAQIVDSNGNGTTISVVPAQAVGE